MKEGKGPGHHRGISEEGAPRVSNTAREANFGAKADGRSNDSTGKSQGKTKTQSSGSKSGPSMSVGALRPVAPRDDASRPREQRLHGEEVQVHEIAIENGSVHRHQLLRHQVQSRRNNQRCGHPARGDSPFSDISPKSFNNSPGRGT